MSQGHSGNFEDMPTHQLNELLPGFYNSYINTEECPKALLKWFPLELSRYLNSSPFHRDIDITCGSEFVSSNVSLDILQKDISVSVASSFDESHSKPIAFTHLQALYNSSSLSNSDPASLQNKIWTDINLYCGVLSRLVLRALKKSSFVIEHDERFARKYYRIVDENVSYEKQVTRIYEQPLSPFCPVRSLELYLSKLNSRSDVFFQQPKKDYSHVQWYLESAIGKNVHSNKLSQICMQAGINTPYRNTALRPISKIVQSQAADYTPEYSDGILRIITGEDDDSVSDKQLLYQAVTYGFVTRKEQFP